MQCTLHNATDSFYVMVKSNLRQDFSSGLGILPHLGKKWKLMGNRLLHNLEWLKICRANKSKAIAYSNYWVSWPINSILVLAISYGQWKSQKPERDNEKIIYFLKKLAITDFILEVFLGQGSRCRNKRNAFNTQENRGENQSQLRKSKEFLFFTHNARATVK